MGRIILLLLLSVGAFAQSPRPVPMYSMYGAHIIAWQPAPIPGYTKINARYQWIAGAFDSTLSVPYGATASLRTLGYNAPGALFFQTSDSSLYAYTGTQWRVVSGGWLTTGNSGTTAGTNFIGTTDAVAVVVKTNNTERARVLSGGNVGIGTSTPDSMLTVEQGIYGKRGVRFSGLPATDTTLSLVGITANGYLVKTNKSSLRPYTFTNGLTESGGTVKLGGTLTEETNVIGDGNDLYFTGNNYFQADAVAGGFTSQFVLGTQSEMTTGRTGAQSRMRVFSDSIVAYPHLGQIYIDTLQATDTTQFIVGYRSNGQLVKRTASSLTPTLQEVFSTESNQAVLTSSNYDISADSENKSFSFGSAQDWGYILIKSDSIVFALQGAQSSDTSAGKPLLITPSGNIRPAATFWRNPIPISYLQAAHAANDIDNTNYGQTWRWNSLSDGVGLTLTSNSTAATGNSMAVLEVSNTGTNADNTQTTVTANITSNKISSSGSSIALTAGANSTSLTNIGGYFSAISGTNNYAIIVPSGGGNVGIGTTTPDSLLTVQNGFWGKRGVRLSGLASSANATDSMLVVNASNGNVGYRAMVTPTNTVTLENKRWKARVGSTTSSGTPTINTDNVDIYKLTAQAADITSFTTNLSGTPNDGDILEIQITGTAARAITWGSSFVSSTVTLPTTTVTTATLTVVVQYFTTSSYGNNKWVCVNSF